MPKSKTKYYRSEKQLIEMVKKAFVDLLPTEITELTEGYFNVAYLIKLSNHQEVILKIAPPPSTPVMTYENNMMFSEVESMKRVATETQVPVPKVLYFDDSCVICEAEYFFMEKLPGRSFAVSAKAYNEKEQDDIHRNIGKYTAMVNELTGDKFGYYGQLDKQGKNWYEVFKSMIEAIYADAKKVDFMLRVEENQLLKLLERDRFLFEMVTTPKLVHWDLWEGNIFIDEGEITGIIDFERCLWADELMEFGFRTYHQKNSFFEGYGMKVLNEEQVIRAKWYDVYFFLIVSLEGEYRGYDNQNAYHWASEMLEKWLLEMERKA